jgi:hypothetical protein
MTINQRWCSPMTPVAPLGGTPASWTLLSPRALCPGGAVLTEPKPQGRGQVVSKIAVATLGRPVRRFRRATRAMRRLGAGWRRWPLCGCMAPPMPSPWAAWPRRRCGPCIARPTILRWSPAVGAARTAFSVMGATGRRSPPAMPSANSPSVRRLRAGWPAMPVSRVARAMTASPGGRRVVALRRPVRRCGKRSRRLSARRRGPWPDPVWGHPSRNHQAKCAPWSSLRPASWGRRDAQSP